MGPADTRLQDAQQQADRRIHRQPPQQVRITRITDGTVDEKRSVY
jgi:hypothetical protein